MKSEAELAVGGFSIIKGGPFHRILSYLRLTGEDQLPRLRAVILLVMLAWLPLALLTVAQALVGNRPASWGFFLDWTTYARYCIAIAVMVYTERHANMRLALLVDNFSRAKLVADNGLQSYQEALVKADRRSSSWLAEALILILAFVWTTTVSDYAISIAGMNWQGSLQGSEI